MRRSRRAYPHPRSERPEPAEKLVINVLRHAHGPVLTVPGNTTVRPERDRKPPEQRRHRLPRRSGVVRGRPRPRRGVEAAGLAATLLPRPLEWSTDRPAPPTAIPPDPRP